MPWEPGDDPRFAPTVLELKRWVAQPLECQRPNGTQLHSLLEDWRAGKLIRPRIMEGDEVRDFDGHVSRLLSPQFHVFVLEHDWAAAFKGADDFKSDPDRGIASEFDFRLPYPECCFEMVLSGKHICLLVRFAGDNFTIAAFIRFKLGWLQPPLLWPEFRPLASAVDAQFRAVGIALEAQVAISEVVRAPFKLNRAREQRGKPPIADYNVVQLARHNRPKPLPAADGEPTRSVRLHFRRGHWRHYETHKTWINWTLVGDPDLGFIDKHYRL